MSDSVTKRQQDLNSSSGQSQSSHRFLAPIRKVKFRITISACLNNFISAH